MPETPNKKTFYVSTAIPYVNAVAHLGHALEFIQADVLARYHRQHGEEVRFVTGVDEHGTKIYRAAGEAGKSPQQFTDEVSQAFIDIKPKLNLSYDIFVRTTSDEHKKSAQALWKACQKDIYKATYTGLYCVGCEMFYTEKDLLDGMLCPIHKKPVEEVSEENYFFKLSAYTEQIKKLIETDAYKVVPKSRKNEIMKILEEGLEDVSISRSKDKLPWGVAVPGDTTQVMWVWFDALPNYISALGYPDGADFKRFWPANVHIIGKDILRFHAAIWPAILLSAGEQVPKTLYVHGFISVAGEKMSKSIGNVVDPLEALDKYGLDAFRYYLLREIPSDGDGDFSWERFDQVYVADLANDLGNLVQRTAAMISRYFQGVLGDVPAHSHDTTVYTNALSDFRYDDALADIWERIRGLNQMIEEEKPWVSAKNDLPHTKEVLVHLAADLLQVADLLLPFLPDTASKIAKTFDGGTVNPAVGILFPKLEHMEVTEIAD